MKKKLKEIERLFATTENEREFWKDNMLVAGMDEVGRGPLAGPVVAACVIMPKNPLLKYVNDSKKVSIKRREELAPLIKKCAIAYSIAFVDENTIDEINILQATRLAFEKAYDGLGVKADIALVDAIKDLRIDARQIPIIKGDEKSYSIGAASIIAKVERDAYMTRLHEQYPMYGFASNKGYGTREHIEAIKKYGPLPCHRRTFIKKFTVNENAREIGSVGEDIALSCLLGKGYAQLERNYRAGHKEIDIIMRDGNVLVFVEVKTRSTTYFGTGAEAVDLKKQANIIEAAAEYCAKNGLMDEYIRFDVVEVDAKTGEVNHIENAYVCD